MMKFAFISRHVPTQQQIDIAALKDIVLTHVGDRDAFDFDPSVLCSMLDDYDGVVCVHPLIAMRSLKADFLVGVFNNVNRAPVGSPPQFETTCLVIVKPFNH